MMRQIKKLYPEKKKKSPKPKTYIVRKFTLLPGGDT